MAYTQWEILLAWLPSSDNTPPNYPHPCIYLGDSTRKPGHVIVLGITSDLSQRDPVWSCNMPWATGKHPQTGLDRPSICQTHWIHHVPAAAVTKVIGFTPDEEQSMIRQRLAMRAPKR